jgi:hypothetical protein
MTLKMSQSLWGTKELPIVGHVLKAGEGCVADPAKVECLLDMAPPCTIMLLKSFLGAAGYLSKYIPEYAGLVLPLREMDDDRPKYTEIDSEWDERRLKAFESVNAALTTAPVLVAPVFSKPWIILTDCSDLTMGACLAQLDDNGIERPVAYASANLSDAQQNYGITDKEGLAVVWAVRKWRHFIHGSSAVVVTDHTCLRDLTTTKEFNNKRLTRYAVDLSKHNLKIIYRAGSDHHLPDLMSRMSRLTLGSLDATCRAVGDQALGTTHHLVQNPDCRIGSRCHGRKDSDLFSPGSAERRLSSAIAAIELHEGKTMAIAALLEESKCISPNSMNEMSGDEHDSRIMDFYDMVASIQKVDMSEIKTAQQNDRFSKHMVNYLLNEQLPDDELEILKVILHAPFYAVNDSVLVRIGKGKELVGKVDGAIVYGPPIKRVYVLEGTRSKVIQAVHAELGHSSQTNIAEAVKSMFDWPAVDNDTMASY